MTYYDLPAVSDAHPWISTSPFGMLHSPRKARAPAATCEARIYRNSKVTIAYNDSILVKRWRENQIIKFTTAEFPISVDVQHSRTLVAQTRPHSARKLGRICLVSVEAL